MNGSEQALSGTALPSIRTPLPGPRSRALATRLHAVESQNITSLAPVAPIFWEAAYGANVRDVDGNIFVDLTAGFGVSNAGHSNRAVAEAIARQARLLPHAMGDVYPAEIKVRLLEMLARIMPAPLRVSILASSGAEAVEAALKTALVRTGRAGVLAFRDSYHGLTYGALAATHRAHFRAPFEAQLNPNVVFAPFPTDEASLTDALAGIDVQLASNDVGAIIVEPIQGRGGIVIPAQGFLAALRERCDGTGRVLIFDEIYTGCGRTGRWLACEHWQVLPDVVVIGKALSGSLPISACIGSEAVMGAWPESPGEAIHTSTFLGNPLGCAAALAQLAEIEQHNLLARAGSLGERIRSWADQHAYPARGLGLIQGVVLPDAETALQVCRECMREGVLVLAEGTYSNVLAITPPAVITDEQLSFALSRIEAILSRYLLR